MCKNMRCRYMPFKLFRFHFVCNFEEIWYMGQKLFNLSASSGFGFLKIQVDLSSVWFWHIGVSLKNLWRVLTYSWEEFCVSFILERLFHAQLLHYYSFYSEWRKKTSKCIDPYLFWYWMDGNKKKGWFFMVLMYFEFLCSSWYIFYAYRIQGFKRI